MEGRSSGQQAKGVQRGCERGGLGRWVVRRGVSAPRLTPCGGAVRKWRLFPPKAGDSSRRPFGQTTQRPNPRAFGGNAPKIKNTDVSRPARMDVPPRRRNGVNWALKRQIRPLRPWLRLRRSPWAGRKAPHPKGGRAVGRGRRGVRRRARGDATRNSLGTTVLTYIETEI